MNELKPKDFILLTNNQEVINAYNKLINPNKHEKIYYRYDDDSTQWNYRKKPEHKF